jgi:SpoVK/Ycf46/Vps4 family AAA+-type ATPase
METPLKHKAAQTPRKPTIRTTKAPAKPRKSILLTRRQNSLPEVAAALRNRKVVRSAGILLRGGAAAGSLHAAETLAEAAELDLLRIDLSDVVSKYIGETEKNLSRIFEAAERSTVVLFFDEADALFGRRTKVSDTHDRYANQETSYLLQKIEEFKGVAILATNRKQNIDDAFTRRFRFVIPIPPLKAVRLPTAKRKRSRE